MYRILIKVLFIKVLIEQVKEQRNFHWSLKRVKELRLKKTLLKTRHQKQSHQKQGHQKQGYQKHFIRSHFTRSLTELTKYSVRSVQPLTLRMRLQQYYCYSCLDVETSCRDGGCRGMRRVSGCTLRALYFVNSVKLLVKWLLMRCFW